MSSSPDRPTTQPAGARARASREQADPARQVALAAVVQVLAMAPWFAAAAATPDLADAWGRSAASLSWLTGAVQLGFVAGAVGFAWAGVPDRVPPARLIGGCAAIAAVATAGAAILSLGYGPMLAARAITGAALAGVYPPGIRVVASWTTERRGTAVALLVGALTLGSALPRLVPVGSSLPWRAIFLLAASTALVAAVLATRLRLGPHARPAARFRPEAALDVVRVPAQRRPVLAYIGHMWELYAFWTWLPALVAVTGSGSPWTSPFAVAGVAGVAGCLLAGGLADRLGRARVARAALGISGACCLLSPAAVGWPDPALAVFLLVWGAAVIGDSPLWSALLGDAAPPDRVGTALTVQTAAGFATTVGSIALLPVVADLVSWRWAFTVLAVGPALGLVAMGRGSGSRPA